MRVATQGKQARREIESAVATLNWRRGKSADGAERETIEYLIDSLRDQFSRLDRAAQLQAASAIADAIEDLAKAVAAAHGPFDGYFQKLEAHLRKLYALSRELHADDALPAAADEGVTPARTRGSEMVIAGLPMPLAVKDYGALRDEYQRYYDRCETRPPFKGNVAYYLKKLQHGRPFYEEVARQTGVPWAFIGVIHGMECGFDFGAHLHNGDPLSARTMQVPAGRPASGTPPFDWRVSAKDALTMKGFHQIEDWSAPCMLYLLEKYNGFGYRMRRLPSPYLWSFSNLYDKGKFVKDGVFDANAISKQCGAGLVLKAALG